MKKHDTFSFLMKAFLSVAFVLALIATCAFIIASPTSVCVANSAIRYYEGRDSAGVLITTENSPITVEREDLTFDIQFDEHYLNGLQIGSVSAKYTFKNPSELTAKVNVLFPIEYLDRILYDPSSIDKFGVKVDDQTVERKLRFSYMLQDTSFSVASEFVKLQDEMIEDDFYTRDKVVHKYVYTCTASDGYCRMYLGGLDSRSVVCGLWYSSYRQNLDGTQFVTFLMGNSNEYTFYAIGDEIDFAERVEFFSDYDCKNKVSGSLRKIEESTTTFEEFALKYYEESYGVSKVDWYNAAYWSLKSGSSRVAVVNHLNVKRDLLCWFEYDMTFAPNQTIVNEVVAPMYPDIDEEHSPSVYVFNYLVSPVSTWNSFKDLNVKINTNYYLIDANEDFEAVDGGYRWHSDTLPDDELSFSLCASQNPGRRRRSSGAWETLLSILLLTILLPICLLIAGLVITILIIKKKFGSTNPNNKKSRGKRKSHAKNENNGDENAPRDEKDYAVTSPFDNAETTFGDNEKSHGDDKPNDATDSDGNGAESDDNAEKSRGDGEDSQSDDSDSKGE